MTVISKSGKNEKCPNFRGRRKQRWEKNGNQASSGLAAGKKWKKYREPKKNRKSGMSKRLKKSILLFCEEQKRTLQRVRRNARERDGETKAISKRSYSTAGRTGSHPSKKKADCPEQDAVD